MPRQLLLLSTTSVHGSSFMEYCIDEIAVHFSGVKEILFVPYARPSGISHDEYTDLVRNKLSDVGIGVKGVHELENPKSELQNYEGIYIGGGNTFLLLKQLYENHLVEKIRNLVMSGKLCYMGSSAGTNVACQTISNTNDMPIVYPPSFNALSLVPFNINPHYLDPDPNSKHKGETRETRINEFHYQESYPVLGLREGSFLKISGNQIELGGDLKMRLFQKGKEAVEMGPEEDFSFLLS